MLVNDLIRESRTRVGKFAAIISLDRDLQGLTGEKVGFLEVPE